VQVHPSPSYATAHPEAHLKSEAWYIVDAQPGAVIYKGIHEGVTPEQFRAAIEANDAAALESMMIKKPVKRGDCHYLPSGTCHALGAGIVVAEVQTPSDTTFRVYDWGRTGRELHIEQAMRCIDFAPPAVAQYERRSHIAGMFTAVSRLIDCEHFRIEKVRMAEGYEQEVPYNETAVWMVLEGSGRIALGDLDDVPFSRGQTLLLPAKMNEPRVKLDADTVWLEITFPYLRRMQMA
jgi:mannose-6-phosphate isomerase